MSQLPYRVLDLLDRCRRLIVVGTHLVLIVLSNYAALWLRFDGVIPIENWTPWLQVLPGLVAIRVLVFIPFRLYEGLWRYTSIWDLRNIILAVGMSSGAVFALTHLVWQLPGYPRSVHFIDTVLLIALLGGVRLGRRIYRELVPRAHRSRRILIYGAGNAGEIMVRELRVNDDYDAEPVGIIDDDGRKRGQRIHGVPVLGTCADAPEIIRSREATEVLIAIPSAQPEVMRQIVRTLEGSKVRITTLPNRRDLPGGAPAVHLIRDLQVEDLLARPPVGLSVEPLHALVTGKRLLVTGAGGSIGSEICRQLATLRPASLIALDRYENALFSLSNQIADRYPNTRLHTVIGDITDEFRMGDVFAEHRPHIVFHAAAHKHVPLMEAHPCEAVKNNIGGSRVVASQSRRAGVERFILISTDKAVNPTSVMGATKRAAELALREMADASETRFTTVRFGNVLASNGSVVPRFLEQIRRGGPVTVTHPEIRRYFMVIPEAVQLVLHAATFEGHGHTYVLDMGEQIRLADMARDLIRLSGYIPDEEIPISYIGLRPGEKLFEELVGDDEVSERSSIDKILRVRATKAHPMSGRLLDAMDMLERFAALGKTTQVLHQLRVVVPNYAWPAEAVSA